MIRFRVDKVLQISQRLLFASTEQRAIGFVGWLSGALPRLGADGGSRPPGRFPSSTSDFRPLPSDFRQERAASSPALVHLHLSYGGPGGPRSSLLRSARRPRPPTTTSTSPMADQEARVPLFPRNARRPRSRT